MKYSADETYQCSKCNQSVTMEVEIEEHEESQTGKRNVDRRFVNRINDYGKCALRNADGFIPPESIDHCPVANGILQNRDRL
ncbi:hypothetical protein BH10ACI3_BH10ACI3_16690 [soil metagenome]